MSSPQTSVQPKGRAPLSRVASRTSVNSTGTVTGPAPPLAMPSSRPTGSASLAPNNSTANIRAPSGSAGASVAASNSVYERSLQRKRGEVGSSAFAYLFAESISYLQKQAKGISDLEDRLNRLGYHVGQRVVELLMIREGRSAKRETKTLGILQLVHTNVWRAVFGRPADALEKSTEHENEYMLVDFNPVVTEYVSVPRDMAQLNCAAFAAGIVEAVLDASLFTAKVSAHSMPTASQPYKTVFLVQFEQTRP